MRKHIQQFIIRKSIFCQFVDRKVMANAKIFSACWRYKSGFHFISLHKIKTSKQHRKLSLTYRGNVNNYQSVHHRLSTLPVGIKNTLVAWQPSKGIRQLSQIYPLKDLLHMRVMLTIIKVFIILFLLYLREQGTLWQFSNHISKLFFQMRVQVYSLLGQTGMERMGFLFGGCKKGRPHRKVTPKSTWLF